MNDIKIFQNPEFGEIRTVMIDDEPWFVVNDVAASLGYSRGRNSLKHIDDDDKRVAPIRSPLGGGEQETYITNESGLYSLIFGSKMESAKKFKKWVTSEVLPSIRKTGAYGQPQLSDNPMELLKIHYAALEQVDKKVSDVDNKVETLEERFNKFEQELPMLPDDADEVHDSLNKRVVFLLGGKESNAYRDKSLSKKVFADAYRALKYNFNVSRYKSIKRSQKVQALQIVAEYKPPLYLAEQIANMNAQQSLDLEGSVYDDR